MHEAGIAPGFAKSSRRNPVPTGPGHAVVQVGDVRAGRNRDDGERAQNLALGAAPAFPNIAQRYHLPICLRDGTRLLGRTRQRRRANAALNMLDLATVSARALIGFQADFRSGVKYGTKPQISRSRCRCLVSGCRRTTGAGWVGARFHDGARFGSGLTVPNVQASASAGRKGAARPHTCYYASHSLR